MIDWNQHPNFASHEFQCPCCDQAHMDPAFLDRLQQLRTEFAAPLIITSGYRCPTYNNRISSTGTDGPHTTGRAADINIWGRDLVALLPLAISLGFTGLGLKQKGAYRSRFLHLDDLPDTDDMPRPWTWTY